MFCNKTFLWLAVLATLVTGCQSDQYLRKREVGLQKLPLRDEWVDVATGHRVVRLSQLGGRSESFYFHNNPFTAVGDKMVFKHTAWLGNERYYTLDFATRQVEKISDRTGKGEILAPKRREIFYMSGQDVCATHVDTKATRVVATLPPGWRVSTVNCDETTLAGSFCDTPTNYFKGKPRSQWFSQVQAAHLPWALFTLDVASGRTNVFYRRNDWLNHLQFSPTDPTLLSLCHEGPWHLVDRIWQIRTDGSGLRLMHPRTMPNEIAGHEFWSPDGQRIWYDLQRPRGEKFYIGSVDTNGANPIRYEIERNNWSVHFNISHNGQRFAGDGGGASMVAKAPDGKWIWLFTPQADGTVRAEKMCSMAGHDYALEPNVHFTPDDKWIIFRSDMCGREQIFAVEIAPAN
jgi:oligogalacturonide lyase